MPKIRQGYEEKENRPISLMNIDGKNPQQSTRKSNPTAQQKDNTPQSSGIYPRDADSAFES